MTLTAPVARPVLADLIPRPSTRPRALAIDAALVVAGAAVTAGLAQIVVPFWPVPVTGQTLAVLLVGASLGAVRGASSLALYGVLALLLPISAPSIAADGTIGGHNVGAALLLGPTFGYIVGFVLAAALVGWLAELRWDRAVLKAAVAFLAGLAVVYAVGVPWLAVFLSGRVPGDQLLAVTLNAGLTPFLLAEVVKIVIAAALLPLAWLGVRALDRRK